MLIEGHNLRISHNFIHECFREKSCKLIFAWYLFDIFLSLLIGLTTGEFWVFIYLIIWLAVFLVFYGFRFHAFIVTALILSVIEETIAYYVGGGLGGMAKSLLDDYAGSIPVFIGFIIGWYLFLRKYRVSEGKILILSGLHGFIIEVILTGAILNPLATIYLGGSSIFIYGSIILAPKTPSGESEPTALKIAVWFAITFILMVIGGILASTLRSLI